MREKNSSNSPSSSESIHAGVVSPIVVVLHTPTGSLNAVVVAAGGGSQKHVVQLSGSGVLMGEIKGSYE